MMDNNESNQNRDDGDDNDDRYSEGDNNDNRFVSTIYFNYYVLGGLFQRRLAPATEDKVLGRRRRFNDV